MSTLLEKFFSILFKLPDGRSMEQYFKSIALIGEVQTDDLKDGKTMPANGLLIAASIDTVKEYFKESSQFYLEAKAVFDQKSNTQTTSQIKYLLIYDKADADTYGEGLDKLKAINTKFAKVIMTSSVAADILEAATWCLANKRFLDVRVLDTTGLSTLKTGLNNYVYALFRSSDTETEPIASAVASTSTCGYFGATDGSAQFTQLVGITPEQYTDSEIEVMDSENVAYYSNVSPVDGGGAEDFGYNWVIGSKMIGGEFRQRMMIKDYIEKSLALTTLEFLNTKPGYDEDGNATLYGMLDVKMRSFQTYKLIIENTKDLDGYFISVQTIRGTDDSIQNTDIEAYNAKQYKVSGYYYDKLVGQKVNIELTVDPTSNEVEQLIA